MKRKTANACENAVLDIPLLSLWTFSKLFRGLKKEVVECEVVERCVSCNNLAVWENGGVGSGNLFTAKNLAKIPHHAWANEFSGVQRDWMMPVPETSTRTKAPAWQTHMGTEGTQQGLTPLSSLRCYLSLTVQSILIALPEKPSDRQVFSDIHFL